MALVGRTILSAATLGQIASLPPVPAWRVLVRHCGGVHQADVRDGTRGTADTLLDAASYGDVRWELHSPAPGTGVVLSPDPAALARSSGRAPRPGP